MSALSTTTPTQSSERDQLKYDYAEAAAYCGPHVTERILGRAVASGRLRHARPGWKVLFSRSMLDDFLASRTSGGAA